MAAAPGAARDRQRKFFLSGVADRLLAAAKANFRLWKPHNGVPARVHLEAIERRTGQRPRELDEAMMPMEAAHVWAWFMELHSARASNGYGWCPISYAEMRAWAELTGKTLRQRDVAMLRRLDLLFLSEAGDGKG